MSSPRPQTKTAAVLQALRRRRGLTALEAFALFETHLAGTIRRLRLAGVHIESEWVNGISRFNRPTRYKKYFAPVQK